MIIVLKIKRGIKIIMLMIKKNILLKEKKKGFRIMYMRIKVEV